ncbi:MAG: hypothetical protein IIT68_08470 [Treponema sp.]|nr:hypothetical protein [Treponema sp.]
MTKRQNTFIFTFIASILNIIMALVIAGALIFGFTFLLAKVLHVQNGTVYVAVWMVCLIAAIALDMSLFGKVCGAVIDKWFYDKLDETLLGKYLPSKRKERGEPQAESFKSVMPDSVKPKEDPLETD